MPELPPQHYLPVYAHPKIGKIVAKIGFFVRPKGQHGFSKIKSSRGKSKASKVSGKK